MLGVHLKQGSATVWALLHMTLGLANAFQRVDLIDNWCELSGRNLGEKLAIGHR